MTEIIIESPENNGGKTVYAADFGLSAEAEDNSGALRRAIDYCKRYKAGRLCLSPGVYRIKNNDFIVLDGMKDFVLDGMGAELVSETSYFFFLNGCHRVIVQDIRLDYDWSVFYPASLVKVLKNENNRLTLEFLDREAPESCDVSSFNRFDEERLSPGVEDSMEIWVAKDQTSDFCRESDRVLSFCCIASGIKRMKAGEIYLVRHLFSRPGAGFYINESSHITLTGNTVYSALGMAHVVNGKSHHIMFDRETICIRPGSGRFMSTDGDGIHVIRSQGDIVIQNCDFSGMGDDDVNIHDCNMFVLEKNAPDSVLLENEGIGEPGDLFELRRPDFSPANIVLKLRDRFKTESGAECLRFYETFPEWVGEGCILISRQFCSNKYIIRNNYFHDHRARGLLLQASCGLAENNVFENIQGAGIYVMLEVLRGLWYEGTGAENVTIRGNTFRNCNCGTWTSSIDIMAVLPDNTSDYKPFDRVEIRDNEIVTNKAPACYFSTCDHLTFAENRICFEKRSPNAAIMLERCGRCRTDNNEIDGRPMTDTDISLSDDYRLRRSLPLYAGLY